MNSEKGSSRPDPNPSVEFLRSGPTLSYDILVFRFYEAAVRDLRQSANSSPSSISRERQESAGSGQSWRSSISLVQRSEHTSKEGSRVGLLLVMLIGLDCKVMWIDGVVDFLDLGEVLEGF